MILYLHFGDPQPDATYRHLLGMIGEFTPVVQALPPDAALADVSGSTRYFDRDAAGLAALIRMRAAAVHDLDVTVGIGPNPLLAQLAAHRGEPGAVRAVLDDPEAITRFLTGLPAGRAARRRPGHRPHPGLVRSAHRRPDRRHPAAHTPAHPGHGDRAQAPRARGRHRPCPRRTGRPTAHLQRRAPLRPRRAQRLPPTRRPDSSRRTARQPAARRAADRSLTDPDRPVRQPYRLLVDHPQPHPARAHRTQPATARGGPRVAPGPGAAAGPGPLPHPARE